MTRTYEEARQQLERDYGDLIARHEAAEQAVDFSVYDDGLDGFLRFCEEVLDVTLWEAQIEVARSVIENRKTVVPGGNGVGKDFVLACIAIWHYAARRGLVLVTGAAERTVGDVFMDRAVRPLFLRNEAIPGDLLSMGVRPHSEDGARIKAMTSTTASKLSGWHHGPPTLVIYAEAQDVPEFAWDAMEGCAGGSEDRFVAIGNPLHKTGKFAQAIRSPQWNTVRISALDHPNVVEGREVIPGGPSLEVIEGHRERGEDSTFWMARVLGETPEKEVRGVFERPWLDTAAENHRIRRFYREAYGETSDTAPAPVMAVDVARFGDDRSVAAIRRGPRLERFETWRDTDTMETVEKVVEIAHKVGIERGYDFGGWNSPRGRIVVDAVAMPGVLDRLKELNWPVKEYKGSYAARKKDRFHNTRTEAFWTLARRLEREEISLPSDEQLFEELLAIRWQVDGKSRAQLEPKDSLKSALGRSPDLADATAMCFYRHSGGGMKAEDMILKY